MSTRSGARSALYDKIASIATMENRERALDFFKTVYTSKFTKKFGEWMKGIPKNRKAYNELKKKINLIPEEYRAAVLSRAREMSNPALVTPYGRQTDLYGYYSEDVKEGDDIYLVDLFQKPKEVNVSRETMPDGVDIETYENVVLGTSIGLITDYTDPNGDEHLVLHKSVTKIKPESLTEENVSTGITYPNGEPKMFFVTSDGAVFEEYGEALKHTNATEIRAGFVSRPAAEAFEQRPARAGQDSSGLFLADSGAFMPLMTLSTSTDTSTRQGLINYLIKKGFLSGAKQFDLDTNNYYLVGEGYNYGRRMFNSILSYFELKNRIQSRVSMDNKGFITITDRDNTKTPVIGNNGRESNMSKKEILDAIKAGRYNELDGKYKYFDALTLALIMELNNTDAEYTKKMVSSLSEEEQRQLTATLNILRSLNISVVGMSDYIVKYKTKYGHEPSAKALADIANGVIAIGENASWEDVQEEVAHFLVEAYENQDEVNSILEEVENTEEWREYASSYYKVYGVSMSGAELDNAVRREILGKVLKNRLASNTPQETSLLGRIRELWQNIISFIRRNLGDARSRLNKVLDDISSAANNNLSAFDGSLLKDSNFVLYSVESMDRNRFFRNRITELKKVLFKLRQLSADRSAVPEVALSRIADIEKKIENVSAELDGTESIRALDGLVSTAEAQVEYLKRLMEAYSGGEPLKASDRQNIRIINEEVLPLLNSIRGYVNNDFVIDKHVKWYKDRSASPETIKADYIRRIDAAVAEINAIQSDIASTLEKDSTAFIDGLLERFNIPQQHRANLKDKFLKVQESCGFLSRWFGTLEHSSNTMNNALGALIAQDNYMAMVESEKEMAPFLKKVRDGNWKVKDFEKLLQVYDGKHSKYLKGPLNMALYEHNFKVAQMKAFREVMPDVFGELTDSEIERLVRDDEYYVAEVEVDENGEKKKKKIWIKPSLNRVNMDIMTAEQEKKYGDIMRSWHEENDEQPYKSNYRDMLEEVYKELAKDNKAVSETTKEYLNNISRQKYMLKQPFYRPDGSFDEEAFYGSSAYEDLNRINRELRAAESDYIYIAGSRVSKDKAASKMAEELRNFREYKKRKMDSLRPEGKTVSLSSSFMKNLKRIAEEPNGAMKAFALLTRGGHLGFSESYWDKDRGNRESIAESGAKARFAPLLRAIRDKDINETAEGEIKEILDTYDAQSDIVKDILRINRDVDDPGEVNVDGMTESEREAFLETQERMDNCYKRLSQIAKRFKIDLSGYLASYPYSERMLSDNYFKDLKDAGYRTENAYEFAMRHMTSSKHNAMKGFLSKLKKGRGNFSQYEMMVIKDTVEENVLQDEWPSFMGIDTSTPAGRSLFKTEFKRYLDTEGYEAWRFANAYAGRMIASYYKKSVPTGYSFLMANIRDGLVDIPLFVKDLMDGTNSQPDAYGGIDLKDLSFTPNTEWLDEESQEIMGKNPNYKPNAGYGRYIPKISKYIDESYFDYFGIKKGDLEGQATKNLKEFDMLQTLIGINTRAFSNYGLVNRNKYVIPQMSKTGLERAESMLTSPMQTVSNIVKDITMDRIDDSLYGRTDNTDSVDVQDRIKAMPRYYTYDLENQNDLTHDLAYSFSNLIVQSNLYKQKQETLAYAMGLENLMLNSQFNNGKKPESTQAYAMFKDFLNQHYYGIRMNMRRVTVNILGYEVDITKLVYMFNVFLTTMNLALSPFVAATGGLTGQLNLLIEGAVGQYIDMNSYKYAQKEITRLGPSYWHDLGSLSRNNKLYVIGETLGLLNYKNRVYGAGYNRALRITTRNPMFWMMEVLNSPLAPAVMVASMDGVRYYDGSDYIEKRDPEFGGVVRVSVPAGFYTFDELKNELREKGIYVSNFKEKWADMRSKSLWNAIEVRDGVMEAKEGLGISKAEIEAEVMRRRPRIRSLEQIVSGALNEENKVGAARNWLGLFTVAHRGWLFLTAQRLWKKRGYNFQTMQEEEGIGRSMLRSLKNTLSLVGKKRFKEAFEAAKGAAKDNSPEAVNIRRLYAYMGMFAIMEVLSGILSSAQDGDDDEDSWMTQFGVYVGYRTINEIASQMPIIFELNIIDTIEDPFVTARKLGEIFDFRNYSLDEVETGIYEGETKLWRLLAKQTFIKQWYSIKTPDAVKDVSDWWLQTNNKSMMLFWGATRTNDDEE